jgi:hypothetical protein
MEEATGEDEGQDDNRKEEIKMDPPMRMLPNQAFKKLRPMRRWNYLLQPCEFVMFVERKDTWHTIVVTGTRYPRTNGTLLRLREVRHPRRRAPIHRRTRSLRKRCSMIFEPMSDYRSDRDSQIGSVFHCLFFGYNRPTAGVCWNTVYRLLPSLSM